MNTPAWLKPGAYGAALGATTLAIVGFSWGGWVTDSTAQQKAKIEVIAALAEICLRQSKHDPQIAQRLIELRKTVRYNRSYLIMKAGWATMPGGTEANRQVATACVEKLGL
jgi:dienelactone hydrolase